MIIPPEVRKKPFEYFILGFIFFLGLIAYFFVAPNPSSRRFIVYFLAAAYFFWSLYHHYKRGDLSLPIIVEYLVISLFGIVLLTATFF